MLPLVIVAIDFDPIARGYIAGLPPPGRNITGLFLQNSNGRANVSSSSSTSFPS